MKKRPEDDDELLASEDLRCAALGNSFHTNTVAILLDRSLSLMGLKEKLGTEAILAKFQDSLKAPIEPESEVKHEETDGEELAEQHREDDALSLAGLVLSNGLQEESDQFLTDEQLLERDRQLSTRLVSVFVRRQEFRGSDVRLDVGSLYRPDSFPRGAVDPGRWQWHVCQSYAFNTEEHINILELRALIICLEWRLRNSKFNRCRALHLTDSQIALCVAVKGRSSSKALNRLLRRYAALQVAAGIYPILGWLESEANPADEPSRLHAS